ncbi:hypothetical protein N7492_000051 [Penicillium capsulatum]|uniref:CENP-V/GFA domain-containing protein n=1 Tax=Penicillium capsulatum TaxID=69766 RepID=A0A9W9IPQ5_9EURO|nr:hypothetical protein N7492_000051 [Penicillium capsulatum]KAJ6130877.1 hypothetical protein N7512_003657 [Penicillium capsulatum]
MAEMGISTTVDPLPRPAFTNAPPENTLHDEEWKHRPPYHIQSPHERGPVQWTGYCQCRRISYTLDRKQPLNAKFCHCRGCQVMHGAPFQWAVIFHKEDVSFRNGSSGLSFYSASHQSLDYSVPTKVSCSFCRTPIMDEGRNVCLLFPQLIELRGSPDEQRKQREMFKPTCHIYYEQRMLDVPDGLPKWSQMDGSSQLLNEGQSAKQ